jgi:hypothetical protein
MQNPNTLHRFLPPCGANLPAPLALEIERAEGLLVVRPQWRTLA